MAEALSNKTGYAFRDPDWLEKALTHSSAQDNGHDNERLEFLGDRVLGLAVAEMLFLAFPEEEEGSLAKRHTALVQQETLVSVARGLGLAQHLRLSPGEKKSGGQQKNKILSDAIEALIGAIYLDGGYKAAHDFIARFWDGMLRQQSAPPEDAKTRLQEWAQSRALPLPQYRLLKKSGSDHAPLFEIEVSVAGLGQASASAATKRAAEKSAALRLLEKIRGGA